MNSARIISVNPGLKTKGVLFEEGNRFAESGKRLIVNTVRHNRSLNFIDFITGIPRKATRAMAVRLVFVRIIFAVAFLAPSIYEISAGTYDMNSILYLVTGISMLCGIGTRVLSLAGVCMFGLIAYSGMGADITTAGISFWQPAVSAMLCMIMAVMGPGLYSADQIVRYFIKGSKKSVSARSSKQSLSYRAYWN